MQNLTYPSMKLLINTLTVKDFGLYTITDPETAATTNMLMIKKLGIDLPYSTAITIKNGLTKAGAYKSVLLQMNGPAPCENCNYEYMIEVMGKRQQPGVNNDEYYPTTRAYGGKIVAIQPTSGGQIADSDKLIAEDDIITQIGLDQDTNTREPSVVHAKRVYLVTITGAVTDTIAFTVGTTVGTPVTLNTTVFTSVNNLNADAGFAAAGLVAFAKDATHIFITSVNPEVLFYISDGAGATTTTVLARYIWLYAKNTDMQFQVKFDLNTFTLTRFNLLIFDNTAAAAGDTLILVTNGSVSAAINHNTTSTTYAASITASTPGGLGYLYASATKTAGSVPVYVYSGIYELKVKVPTTTGVTITSQFSGGGVWPSLTGKDVFNIFAWSRDLGEQSVNVYLDQADPDALYNHLSLERIITNVGAIHGASHLDSYKQRIDIYIKQGYGSTNLWDASGFRWENNADAVAGLGGDTAGTFTADTTINVLLHDWSGLTVGTDFLAIV